ncbi:thioredoxin [Thalassotalea maritima]|uniref:thioredoxin n=1 Tax=Thalassotalea maritima TaxID=3242416 RepID=UPI003527D710
MMFRAIFSKKINKGYQQAVVLMLFTCSLLGMSVTRADEGMTDHIGALEQGQLLEDFPKFADNYTEYQPSSSELAAVEKLNRAIAAGTKLSMDVYLGTWCHDSQREVPKLLKLYANSNVVINMVGLDRQKTDPQNLAKQAGVEFTPTIIVKVNEHVLGRIIERPQQSLAEDIWAIYQASL